MSDTVFHGSPIDIKDDHLKPSGWSTYVNGPAVCVSESELLATTFALFMHADYNKFRQIDYFNKFTCKWEQIYLIKSTDSLKGFIYEVERPKDSPVDYLDENTAEYVSEPKPGFKAIFEGNKPLKIFNQRVVDYNYIKTTNNPWRDNLFIVKKSIPFREGVEKVKEKLRQIDKKPVQNQKELKELVNKVLNEYTDG